MINPFKIYPKGLKFELWFDDGKEVKYFGTFNTEKEAEDEMELMLEHYEAEIL